MLQSHTERWLPTAWSHKQFTAHEIDDMRSLPLEYRMPELPNVVFCHSSPHNDYMLITPFSTDHELKTLFINDKDRVIIRAHNHIANTVLWGDRIIYTVGSAGLALSGRLVAEYAILDTQYRKCQRLQHFAIPYNHKLAIERCVDSGFLAETGVVGRLLYRELINATPQIIPFFNLYERWMQHEPLSLTAGLERWLNM
jgi:hypothetical protein